MHKLQIKRIYEEPSKDDGIRILVDRLWPRGVKKETADLDYWCKDITPSTELRKWFSHDPKKFEEFSKDYINELKAKKAEIEKIKDMLKEHNVTLLYAAKDPKVNHALVLRDFILNG